MKQIVRAAFGAVCMFAAAAAVADPPPAFTLRATAICSAGHPAILLEWSPSEGTSSYSVARDDVSIAQGLSSDTTSFIDDSNGVGSSHSYVVSAFNEEGTTKSNSVSASAPSSVCVAPPTAPTLNGSASCDASASPKRPFVSLSWNASAGATSYAIVREGEVIAATSNTSATDFTVTAGSSYTYAVRALNSGGSADSNPLIVVVAADICGTVPGPFNVGTAAACASGAPKVTVTWSASANAASYVVERNGTPISAALPAPSQTFDDTNPPSDFPLSYSVAASNSSGTTESNTSTITVPAGLCGGVVPSSPVLTATAFCNTGLTAGVRLNWTASNGATSYVIVRDGVTIATLPDTQVLDYDDTNVAAGQTHSYQVRAVNPGASSTSNTATVQIASSVCAPIVLSAGNIALNPASGKPGDSIGVSFAIANGGSTASAPFILSIRIGSTLVATKNIPAIAAFATLPLAQSITIPSISAGTYFVVLSAEELQGSAQSGPLQVVAVVGRRRAVAH
jgi:fibronectin type 3 domain-containing protein